MLFGRASIRSSGPPDLLSWGFLRISLSNLRASVQVPRDAYWCLMSSDPWRVSIFISRCTDSLSWVSLLEIRVMRILLLSVLHWQSLPPRGPRARCAQGPRHLQAPSVVTCTELLINTGLKNMSSTELLCTKRLNHFPLELLVHGTFRALLHRWHSA